jgi:glycosyltransferase involved in cell wall biosynthesis
VLRQTFTDFELIIVDDGGGDDSINICRSLADERTHIVHQANRGLAGARNTGIAAARGEFIALLDSDDLWEPEKLATHVAHLRSDRSVGISYTGSIFIDEEGRDIGLRQRPRVGEVTPRDVFCGKAVGNGSTPVLRRKVFDDIARPMPDGRVWYFDESLRRSEDVECWTRIALTTQWKIVGLPGFLTRYRLNGGGLSADVMRQLDSWNQVYDKIVGYAPGFIDRHGREARARQYRYLARRCVKMRERRLGLDLARSAVSMHPRLLWDEPVKTLVTLFACAALRLLPEHSVAVSA